ncbi:MAG: hypothetical protein J0647_00750 [Campylobacteraceae bacterium]|nr:hypothetical protein [Campylobacteraceae bacterium]
MKISKYSLLVSSIYLLSGCVSQPSIPKVEEAEIAKYEKAYMAEYERIKIEMASSKINKTWVQPKNKKEECKVKSAFQTNKPDYSLFWDGECKDGYAEGLGSTFEIEQFSNRQEIAIFKKGEPDTYRVFFNHLDGITNEGEYSNSVDKPAHYVLTIVDEKNNDLKISYDFGVDMSNDSPAMRMQTYPFYDVVEYFKVYPNFSYVIADLTKNEFDNRGYEFNIKDNKNGKFNGYGFATMKKGGRNAGEMVNGTLVRSVQLPQSYFDKANSIFSEIKHHANIALEAQKKALIIKEKYKKKICQDSIKVDFMDNNEYKAICKEDEKFAQLKTKIDAKLAQIEQQKQAKRQQQNEQRLIQAKEAEAIAAQRRAAAAEEANNQAAWDGFNQSLQNMNNNMQMQQLNNNLMQYNLMPKRYDVYLH